MVKRDDLTKFLYKIIGQDLLEKAASLDVVPNSVQIKGNDEVEKVVFGVSCSLEFLEQAIATEAQYCVFHHGLSPDYLVKNGRFDIIEDRLRLIFTSNLTIAGFHYTLDAHPKLGNNAVIISKLGAKRKEPYFEGWGWVGEFDKPINVRQLADKCAKLFQHDVFAVYAGPEKVKRIGVCSGGAKPRGMDQFEILDKNIDAHITGEIGEADPYQAEEGGYNYFACGHYATEIFGVQALAKAVKDEFKSKLQVEFLDIPSTL